MIALTGASGHLGQLTLTHLLQKTPASQRVAIVRDPAKLGTHRHPGIAIRTADYDDMDALEEALDGVETLLQVSSSASGSVASRQELNVVQAAGAAGVRKIVYTSTLVPGGGCRIFGWPNLRGDRAGHQGPRGCLYVLQEQHVLRDHTAFHWKRAAGRNDLLSGRRRKGQFCEP